MGQAGGFPLEFPVSTLSETFQKPTPMLYRNLLAMETEELLRSYPVDGAVLMGGCDKTTPALLMGAASVDLPTVFVPAGPMLPGHWRGETLGSGTDMVEQTRTRSGRGGSATARWPSWRTAWPAPPATA
ncbi:dihydroxy-acid dehydratase [Streptomyces narbonensis]